MDVREWLLVSEERENPHTAIDAVRGDGTAWSTGNTVRALVHGRDYFAELHERICALGPGDRFYFADWQGDPDQQLTDDPRSTLNNTLIDAVRRGVEVRGLLWRSHWHRLGFSAHRHRQLGEEIGEAGGQCLRDMRVRTRGAHHQKFVVIRHADDPTRDIAYVGGIDLCHGRRDDAKHQGDGQPVEMARAYGPTPAWHDVQVAVQGPAVHDVETTFRERWEDSTPLTVNPGRLLSSLVHQEDLSPEPLGEQTPPPPPRTDGHEIVQVVRTFPVIYPKSFDFAPHGERSVMLGNAKAIAQADRLVYVEDQYLWSEEVGEHFAQALRAKPDLRLIVILPMVPDREGAAVEVPQLYGRMLAMRRILEAGGDRVAVFGLTNDEGMPVYVHSKTCIIDHRWASVGSDNLNRRSWTSDSEIACTVVDARGDLDGPAPEDSFPRVLLRTLVAEHLGCSPDEVPEDPHELFDAMVACASALDAWYAGDVPDRRTGVRGVLADRRPRRPVPVPVSLIGRIPGHARRRRRVLDHAAEFAAAEHEHQRPPGRLRRLAAPELTAAQLLWAPRLYDLLFDPDGRPRPGEGS
ncbi:phospholipase D family protein [Nocardioides mangrovi]|uniref:Phospholipase D-like domain-containing protein n=1 Tax=Nocardioides mangrovi TaxID=2874580 RepID=A0ABS7UJJ9_9ACTN|nr:phospholipase D-like domain-containing protein [Nocardioides mangrovi]MBZ5741000.1 phospholipase D-like domain-containing protein [Nocardioides mangrovi]